MNMFIKCYRYPELAMRWTFPTFCTSGWFSQSLTLRNKRTLQAKTNVHTKTPFNYRVHNSTYWNCWTWSNNTHLRLFLAFSHLYHIGVKMISILLRTCKILWVSKDSEKGKDCFKLINHNDWSMCDDIICSHHMWIH